MTRTVYEEMGKRHIVAKLLLLLAGTAKVQISVLLRCSRLAWSTRKSGCIQTGSVLVCRIWCSILPRQVKAPSMAISTETEHTHKQNGSVKLQEWNSLKYKSPGTVTDITPFEPLCCEAYVAQLWTLGSGFLLNRFST